MKRITKRLAGALVFLALASSCLLKPMDHPRFDIHFKKEALLAKKEYLARVKQGRKKTGRPNVLLITADDLPQQAVSAFGDKGPGTPHIDSLLQSGVIFRQAYCTSPICSPSRASLMSGRYQQRFGFEFQPMMRYPRNKLELFAYQHFVDTDDMILRLDDYYPGPDQVQKQGLPPTEINLAEVLQAASYATALIGKWHLGYYSPLLPLDAGFDYHYGFYEAYSLYAPRGRKDIVEYEHDNFAIQHIWSRKRKGPCAIRRNHHIIKEEEYLTFALSREAVAFMEKQDEFFVHLAFSAPHTPFQAPLEYYNRFPQIKNKNLRVYWAMIAALDDAVGEVLTYLEESGRRQNTLIFFASDNGGATYTEAADNRPLKGGKFTQFEGGIRVPAFLSYPKSIKGPLEFSPAVSLMDFFSTALAEAGLSLPPDRRIDGENLLPYLKGEKQGAVHQDLYWRSGHNRAVLHEGWKLIKDSQSGKKVLYQLDKDLSESRNLAPDNPGKLRELEELFRAWEKDLQQPAWPYLMDHRFIIDGEEFRFAL